MVAIRKQLQVRTWLESSSSNDTLSITENAQFAWFGSTNFNLDSTARQGIMSLTNVRVHGYAVGILTNLLTGGSVNTFNLVENAITTVPPMIITITAGVNGISRVASEPVTIINNYVGIRWNSDSVGTTVYRGLSAHGTY